MTESLLNRHKILESVPPLARYKALLLEYGVDCDDNLLEQLPELGGMKVKYRNKKHLVKNRKLTDSSRDITVVPSELILEKEGKQALSKVSYKSHSPLKLVAKEGELFLVDMISGETFDVKVQPVKKRDYSRMRIPSGRLATEGTKLENYVQLLGMDRIGILAFSGCAHWLDGKPCKYCDENPKRLGEFPGMLSLNTLVDYGENVKKWLSSLGPRYLDGILYAYQTLLKTEKIEPHVHLHVMAGNLNDLDSEWEFCMQVTEVLNSVRPVSSTDSYLNIAPPSKNNRNSYLENANEVGFRNIDFNLEVIGEDTFNEVCPGKARLFGYQGMVDALKKAVDIFGKGRVRSNFVLGAQPVEELLQGVRDLADYGIVADYTVFTPKKGTAWVNRPAPSIDTIVYFTKELVDIYQKHGFEGIYCGLSSRSSIVHEIIGR